MNLASSDSVAVCTERTLCLETNCEKKGSRIASRFLAVDGFRSAQGIRTKAQPGRRSLSRPGDERAQRGPFPPQLPFAVGEAALSHRTLYKSGKRRTAGYDLWDHGVESVDERLGKRAVAMEIQGDRSEFFDAERV